MPEIFYICPGCGCDVPESRIVGAIIKHADAEGHAHYDDSLLFCNEACFRYWKSAIPPEQSGNTLSEYRRCVSMAGLGRKNTTRKSKQGIIKPSLNYEGTGNIAKAFERVFDLDLFCDEISNREGRLPVCGERASRLRRLMPVRVD